MKIKQFVCTAICKFFGKFYSSDIILLYRQYLMFLYFIN